MQFSDRTTRASGLKDFLVGGCGGYFTNYLRGQSKQQAQELGQETLTNASLW